MKKNFWEIVQLLENDDDWRDKWSDIEKRRASANASREFSADQLGYDSGDHGEDYLGPVAQKKPVRRISGSAESDEEMLHRTLTGKFGAGALSKRMRDVGASYRDIDDAAIKDRETRTSHFPRERGAFEPGAAIPERPLSDLEKDVTLLGKKDVSDQPNPTAPSTGRFDRVQDELTGFEVQNAIRQLVASKRNDPENYTRMQKKMLHKMRQERRSHKNSVSNSTRKKMNDLIDLLQSQLDG